jgi:hypothetical protein
MSEREQEVLRFVKQKHIWKLLLSPEFPEALYKEAKKKYFLSLNNTRIGVPKDAEVARATLDHLFKIGYITNKDTLTQVMQTSFFSKNIFNPEYYTQKLETIEHKPNLDLGLIEKQEYFESKVDEFTERAIREKSQYIDEKIKEKMITYDSIPSVLDEEQVIFEPKPLPESKPSQYDPWWKKLGLTSDPFPSTVGIRNIKKSFYDEVIVFTGIYEQYVNNINNVQTELFKNIVFYGEFGSGKTTLFQYLEPLLIKNNIHPAFIILYAEPDYQNFLMRFKLKLRDELVDIYYNLTGSNLMSSVEGMMPDSAINHMFKLISNTDKCSGFIVFIDDIYKPPEYENTALKFLNYLQTFRDELAQELDSINLGFFVSAPPEWETTLKEKQAYSGSIGLEEHMPFPTVEQARTVFNQRLAFFSPNKERYKDIVDTDSAYQVYRTLLSKKSFTFRAFITECLRRFRAGNFGRLTANPVSITRDTLENISQILSRNVKLSEGLNEILNSSHETTRSKSECIELLVQIFNEKGYSEDSEVFQRKMYYFRILRNAGLITKNRNNSGKTVWNVSRDLMDFNTFVYNKYAYYLDDYFLKLFEGKLQTKKIEPTISTSEDFSLIQALLDRFRRRTDTRSASVRLFLDDAFSYHKEIEIEMDNRTKPMSLTKLVEGCQLSIKSLSKAIATYVGMPATGTDFWNDYVHYPESLRVFTKNLDKQSQSYEPNTFYLHGAYLTAFREITRSFSEQVQMDEVLPIPIIGLKVEEFKDFEIARSDNIQGDYISAARRTSTLVENKLREFIYSIFLLQYGDQNHRMQRIPIKFHSDIKKHIIADRERGFASSKNELTYLNRDKYYEILTGRRGEIGYDNWLHTFSKIFAGWDAFRIQSYMKSFYHFNLLGAHNKGEVLTSINQSDINQYIMDSIKTLVKINQSYHTFLDRVKRGEISGSTEIGYYFQLDNDTYTIQPVRVLSANRTKITELLKESKNTSIDLSCPSIIEQRYGIDYQEFFAILSDLLGDSLEVQLEITKRNDPIIVVKPKVK